MFVVRCLVFGVWCSRFRNKLIRAMGDWLYRRAKIRVLKRVICLGTGLSSPPVITIVPPHFLGLGAKLWILGLEVLRGLYELVALENLIPHRDRGREWNVSKQKWNLC